MGIRNEHMKMFMHDDLLSLELYKFAVAVARDEIASEARSFLNHLEVKPAYKPLFPEKLRPVTPPGWWVRVPSSSAARSATPKLNAIVGGSQFGVGL